MIVEGQTHGGIAQGVGQALLEGMALDRQIGQVLSGSFMDYGISRADDLPSFRVEHAEHPTGGNPLRIKGGGEGNIRRTGRAQKLRRHPPLLALPELQ